MNNFSSLRPLIPYRVNETDRAIEQKRLDDGRAQAQRYIASRGLVPGFKKSRNDNPRSQTT
jgi:hypothetical protein